MSLNQLAPSQRKVFTFADDMGGVYFTAYSYGNGRFIRGSPRADPRADLDVCFRLHKDKNSIHIQILEDKLLRWLQTIPSLHDELDDGNGIGKPLINMDRLLPRYPEISAKFDQDRREGRSFDALELFVRHFLQEGSVFATLGLEHLHKSYILTELHLNDILRQSRHMSENLDFLDEAVEEIYERDIEVPYNSKCLLAKPNEAQLLNAIRRHEDQERRTMVHQLLAKVAKSCQKLLNASTMQDASAGVKAFANQVGTSGSVWKSGTRVIRDMFEGYMTRSLSDIVSALQVVNAMRSVMPPSELGYSKKEFIDDIPRWASLLSPNDHLLFFEIASYLWGIPASTVAHEMADSFVHPLMFSQDIDERLGRASRSRLSVYESVNFCRLKYLRRPYIDGMSPIHRYGRRLTAAEWDPLAKQTTQGNPPTNAPKRLMADVIFGVILLYFCLSRYGFSTLRLPDLPMDGEQDWPAWNQVTARNNVIRAMYAKFTSPLNVASCKSTDNLLPKSSPLSPVLPDGPLIERVREYMAAIPGTTITVTPMDGTVYCEHCNSKFKLGKNGRRGQASNLQKHIKIHHPETIPNFHREIYDCRYGCGTRDPNKSNIKAHESKHCANRKGKQPRCHGKWRQTIT